MVLNAPAFASQVEVQSEIQLSRKTFLKLRHFITETFLSSPTWQLVEINIKQLFESN